MRFAISAVERAGALILNHFQKEFTVGSKGMDNPVTSVDLAADRELREALTREFPHDGWLSEETPESPSRLSRERVWVVDPLDGTREFVRGMPEFAISVALVEKRKPKLAVVYNPARNELFATLKGSGAFHQGARLRVSRRKSFRGARLLISRTERSRQRSGLLRA